MNAPFNINCAVSPSICQHSISQVLSQYIAYCVYQFLLLLTSGPHFNLNVLWHVQNLFTLQAAVHVNYQEHLEIRGG